MSLSLRNKFLIPTILIIILGLGAVTFISFKLAEKAISGAMLQQSEQIAGGLRSQVAAWVDDITKDLAQVSRRQLYRDLVLQQEPDPVLVGKAMEHLKQTVQTYGIYEGVGLFNKDGIAVAYTVEGSNGTLDVSGREYFKKAIRGEVAISDALESKTTGKPILVVAMPFRVNGSIEGIFISVVDLSSFSKAFIDPVALGEGGYAFMMSRAGYLCAHPDKASILTVRLTDNDWGREIAERKNGVIRYEWRGIEKIVTFRTEEATGWTIGVTANIDDIFSSVVAIRNSNILISITVLLVVSLVVFLIVRGIVAALKKCVFFAEAVAEGDLDKQLSVDRQDEIGNLSNSLNTMVTKLKEMIAVSEQKSREAEAESAKAQTATAEAEEARAAAENAKREGMLHAAEQLEHIVGRITGTSEDLFTLIQNAANGSGTQRERAAESATAIEEMNATVLEVARNAGEAAEHADAARQQAEHGAGVVESVVEAIGEVDERSRSLKNSLSELGNSAESIGSVMTVITDIADQTNLLALNAAIEAARAGDAGRGFAVVADEVRKLAEKTMLATKEVEEAIKAIQQASKENIAGMDEASQAVARSTELATRSGDALREIVTIVVANSDQVRSIATASEQQSAASEEISQGSEEINTIAAETAGAMVQAEEAVQQLSEMSVELQQLIRMLQES